jgi:hypothetical protein
MATSMATIVVNDDPNLGFVLSSNEPQDTVAVQGTAITLEPQTQAENSFVLNLQPGADVSAITGVSNVAISNRTLVSLSVNRLGTSLVLTCTYLRSFSTPQQISFDLELVTVMNLLVRKDPTITFNPPSGGTDVDTEKAPVAAELVLA